MDLQNYGPKLKLLDELGPFLSLTLKDGLGRTQKRCIRPIAGNRLEFISCLIQVSA